MNFECIGQLNEQFQQGKLTTIPKEFSISGVSFSQTDASVQSMTSMCEEGHKSFVIYSVTAEGKTASNYAEIGIKNITLMWAMSPTLSILPVTAVVGEQETIKEAGHNIISDIAEITFKRFGKTVKAKTDTGANMSSLHVDKWKLLPGKNRVEFTSKLFGPNVLTTDIIDQVVVKTSEGTEMRPVVAFDISVNGVDISQAKFNLNDRSHMEDPILLGQNILEKGKFLVDPTKIRDTPESQETDWAALQEQFKDVTIVETADNEQARELYNLLLESNISFKDIVQHLKTVVLDTIDENVNY